MKRVPMYVMIKDFILERIRSGILKPNDRIPSEKELMNMFNVSRITVRRALDELNAEGYIYRLQGIGAFVSENAIGQPRGRFIGVIIDPASDYLSMGILKGLEEFFWDKGYRPIVQFTSNNESESGKLKNLSEVDLSGLIVMPHEFLLDDIEFFRSKGIPIVFVDRTVEGFGGKSVTSDNEIGGYLLTSHLAEHHSVKRMAFVTWESLKISSVRERYEGALKAAKENGADLDFIRINRKEDIEQKIYEFSYYEAIFACTDLIAVEIIKSFSKNDIKVPENVKIVGFDDRPFSKYVHPPLTTARQFPERMGEEAGKILLKLMNGEDVEDVKIPVEIVIRNSCGC